MKSTHTHSTTAASVLVAAWSLSTSFEQVANADGQEERCRAEATDKAVTTQSTMEFCLKRVVSQLPEVSVCTLERSGLITLHEMKVFLPSFFSKRDSSSTVLPSGMGLATEHKLVRANWGWSSVFSQRNECWTKKTLSVAHMQNVMTLTQQLNCKNLSKRIDAVPFTFLIIF